MTHQVHWIYAEYHVKFVYSWYVRWSLEAQESFDALKQALIGPEIMAYPLDDGKYILDTEACEVYQLVLF